MMAVEYGRTAWPTTCGRNTLGVRVNDAVAIAFLTRCEFSATKKEAVRKRLGSA